jgi:hypothetical protein
MKHYLISDLARQYYRKIQQEELDRLEFFDFHLPDTVIKNYLLDAFQVQCDLTYSVMEHNCSGFYGAATGASILEDAYHIVGLDFVFMYSHRKDRRVDLLNIMIMKGVYKRVFNTALTEYTNPEKEYARKFFRRLIHDGLIGLSFS